MKQNCVPEAGCNRLARLAQPFSVSKLVLTVTAPAQLNALDVTLALSERRTHI